MPFPFLDDLPQFGGQTRISCVTGGFFSSEPPGKPGSGVSPAQLSQFPIRSFPRRHTQQIYSTVFALKGNWGNVVSWIGEGSGTPLQCSCLENPMDGGAWWAAVHWVAKSRTRLSDFTFSFHFHALEKEMATHSSVLAWRISGTEEPGGLPSMGSQSRTQLKQLSSSQSFDFSSSHVWM